MMNSHGDDQDITIRTATESRAVNDSLILSSRNSGCSC